MGDLPPATAMLYGGYYKQRTLYVLLAGANFRKMLLIA